MNALAHTDLYDLGKKGDRMVSFTVYDDARRG